MEATPQLALLAFALMAEQRGLTDGISDSAIEPRFRERIVDQLDDAVCVGISIVTGPMIVEAIEVARAVKAARPEVPVVLVGWHPSTLAEQSLSAPYIDVVVRGQGELTFGEILDRFSLNATLDGVLGCSYRAADGHIVHNPSRHTI